MVKNFVTGRVTIVLLVFSLLHFQAFAVDLKQVISNARGSYYSLQTQGLKTFQCDAEPNWQKFLEVVNQKPVPANDPKLKQLKDLRFSVAINERGESTITPFMANGGKIDPTLNEMVDGFKQMLSGFYQTWTALVLTNPFPEAYAGLTLKQEGDNVRLLGKDGGSDVEILLSKNYAITEMRVASPGSKIIMFPKFAKTEKGLLLTDVDSDINDGQQKVQLGITYQNVEGLKLPDHASLKVTLPEQVVAVDISFSKYQVTKQ
ncbi:MAG TPA: hypothetical protein VNZ47_02655 [Candidatus Dormibacteraeota bacterium]|nr:hypothetical protein [Candidatus Dormibacteraeota bacterium]